MSAERDANETGASTGPSIAFVKIGTKDGQAGKFWKGDTCLGDTLTFFLDRVDLEFRDAMAEKKIPAHWAVVLNIWGNFDGPGGEGKSYTMSISSHWKNPILANVINGIAGALEKDAVWIREPKKRKMRIWLMVKKKTNAEYVSAMVFRSEIKGDYLPVKHEFNEGLMKFNDVPADMTEANDYWLGLANDVRKMTGGIMINANRATIGILPGVLPEPAGSVTPPPPPPPATTTEQPATPVAGQPPADMNADGFWVIVDKNYLKGDSAEALLSGLKSSIQGFAKYQPIGVTAAAILERFNGRLRSLNLPSQFVQQGTDYVILPLPNTPEGDLPF